MDGRAACANSVGAKTNSARNVGVTNKLPASPAILGLRETLRSALDQLEGLSPEELIEHRYQKFRQMGNFFL